MSTGFWRTVMTLHLGSRWLVALACCVLLVACHRKQKPVMPAATPVPPVVSQKAPPPPPAPSPVASPVAAPAVPTEEELFSRMSLAELNAKEPLDDAFFAYDQWEL